MCPHSLASDFPCPFAYFLPNVTSDSWSSNETRDLKNPKQLKSEKWAVYRLHVKLSVSLGIFSSPTLCPEPSKEGLTAKHRKMWTRTSKLYNPQHETLWQFFTKIDSGSADHLLPQCIPTTFSRRWRVANSRAGTLNSKR